jgi:hypothetical protein
MPNGRLDLLITVGGLTHRVQMPCGIVLSAGDWKVIHQFDSGILIDPTDAAQSMWDVLKKFYHSSVTAPGWELQEHDVNIFVVRAAGSVTGAGTNGSAYAPGMVYTMTFKDADQHLARLQFAEISDPTQAHAQYGGLNSDQKAIVDTCLAHSSSTNEVGNWLVTRATSPYSRFLSLTGTSNRKIRRARGLT